jgi:hypothetical protein
VKGEGGRGKGEGRGRKAEGLGTSVPSTTDYLPSPFPLPPSPLSILFLGDPSRPEFQQARASLNTWGVVAEFADADTATAALGKGRVLPDAIVVAEASPGQFSHRAIDGLRRLAPLARILGLMGSWCEGETRSGSPWPAAVRTYWHQWPTRCNRQLRRLALGEACSWALPATATDEERLLTDLSQDEHARASHHSDQNVSAVFSGADILVCPGRRDQEGRQECLPHCSDRFGSEGMPCRGAVAIHSRSREMADWLSAACRSRGYAAIWQRDLLSARVEGATAGIFDAGDFSDDECATLQRFVIALRPAPVIALLSFPRIENHQAALSAGAAAVLSKPVAVDDLHASLSSRNRSRDVCHSERSEESCRG